MAFWDDIRKRGSSIALTTGEGEVLTYASLADAADELERHLDAQSIGRPLAFLLAENCPEAVAAYLACLRSGTAVAMQPSRIHAHLLASLIATYDPKFVILPRERASEVPSGNPRWSGGRYVLLETPAAPCAIDEQTALLVSTSGSTGSPKLVRQSYRNLAANAASIAEYLGITTADRPITTLPMSYVYGLSVINSHLSRGATVVLTEHSIAEKEFWNILRNEAATSLAGVPYTYEMLKRLRFSRMDLPSLRVLTQAGGRLGPELVTEYATLCRDAGRMFFVMYGAAEATARMSYLPPDRALEKPSSIGAPIPGGEMWIESETGQRLEGPDVVGELVYRGENVSLGYAICRQDLARGDDRQGVLRTGDLARRDQDGYYYVVGRKSRFIKVFGNRVNLDELEQHIRAQGIECVCGGQDDKLRVFLVDATRTDTVLRFVEQLTGLHRSGFEVKVIDAIPRNESGKVNYASLS
jgi:acyl-coenzyme A synthetase/AMP-(fatty) acid ligase